MPTAEGGWGHKHGKIDLVHNLDDMYLFMMAATIAVDGFCEDVNR